MRMEKLTTTLQTAIGDAQSLAVASQHTELKPAHLFAAWLEAFNLGATARQEAADTALSIV